MRRKSSVSQQLVILYLSCFILILSSNLFASEIDEMLLKAVKDNNTKEAINFVKKGANVNYKSQDKYSFPIIQYAISNKNYELLEYLLKKGADVDSTNAKGITNIALAIFENDSNSIVILKKYGADVNKLIKEINYISGVMNDVAIIHLFANANLVEFVGQLLKNGANVDIRDGLGNTPLMYTIIGNSYDVAELLLKNGADVNAINNEGVSTLLMATQNNDIKMARLLLSHGANINYANFKMDNFSALIQAVYTSNDELVKLFLNYNADPDLAWKDITSLMYLAYNGDIDLMKLLISSNANLNLKTSEGLTALHYAVLVFLKSGNLEALNLLINSGANINIVDDYGRSLLHYAVYDYRAPHKKGDIHKIPVTLYNSLPLEKRKPLIDILLKAGVNEALKDNDNKTYKDYYNDTLKLEKSINIG